MYRIVSVMGSNAVALHTHKHTHTSPEQQHGMNVLLRTFAIHFAHFSNKFRLRFTFFYVLLLLMPSDSVIQSSIRDCLRSFCTRNTYSARAVVCTNHMTPPNPKPMKKDQPYQLSLCRNVVITYIPKYITKSRIRRQKNVISPRYG